MHYVDSTMVCRSGKGYCSGITGISKKKKWGKKGKRKGEKQYQNFPIFTRTYVIGAQKNRLDETALLGTCNEC